MPRERSAKQSSHVAYETTNPLPHHHQLQAAGLSHTEQPQQIIPVIQDPLPKKQFVCNSCDYVFTTSGHLARHATVHTGEKRHKCPFPGCETRCSRQDNLQQHYRVHLSPESRRRSTPATRSAMIKSYTGDVPPPSAAAATAGPGAKKRSTKGLMSHPPPRKSRSKKSVSPSSSNTQTDSDEQTYNITDDDLPGPDSPPLLVQANLPALLGAGYELDMEGAIGGGNGGGRGGSGPSRSSSPLDYGHVLPNEYPNPSAYPVAMQQQYDDQPAYPAQESGVYSYEAEQQQQQQQQGYAQYDQHASQIHHQQQQQQDAHAQTASRHSIAHIAPTDYPPAPASPHHHLLPALPAHMHSAPPSPHSDASPHSSGPITPTYAYRDDYRHASAGEFDGVTYYHAGSAGAGGGGGGGGAGGDYAPHLVSHVHDSFSHAHMGRYHQPSPPVIVAAQERMGYGEIHAHHAQQQQQQQQQQAHHHQAQAHQSHHEAQQQQQGQGQLALGSPYLHHPRPITGAAQYHIPLALQPVDWAKAHGGGVGVMH